MEYGTGGGGGSPGDHNHHHHLRDDSDSQRDKKINHTALAFLSGDIASVPCSSPTISIYKASPECCYSSEAFCLLHMFFRHLHSSGLERMELVV
ncbi:hypothetical protein K1719_010732 [Acacia pycnantha]|nr:hypothetical protein K1719_010732 [Acacia pycnantha]